MEIKSRLLPCGLHIVGAPPPPAPHRILVVFSATLCNAVTHTLSRFAMSAAFTGS
jgi:hypothetical protein